MTANATHKSGRVNRVTFHDGSKLIGTDTVAPYSIPWSGMTSGVHVLTAIAVDDLGLTATSGAVQVKVSKALKSVRDSRKNAAIIENAVNDSGATLPQTQRTGEIEQLIAELEQTYFDFAAEKPLFASAAAIERYMHAALFLARSSVGLAKRPASAQAVTDRLNRLDAYLSFCEDLMVSDAISQTSRNLATEANARTDVTISQPDTRNLSDHFLLATGGQGKISTMASDPFTMQIINGQSYELGGVSVTIDGQAAELSSVSPTTIVFTVPSDLPGGMADIVVTSREGNILHGTANVFGLNPTIFLQTASTNGSAAIFDAFSVHSGSFATTNPLLGLDMRTRLTLMATGISSGVGNTDTNNDIWQPNGQTLPNLAESVVVEARTSNGTIVNLPVEFAGQQGALSGLDQVNVIVPPQLAGAGSIEITIVAGGVRSKPVTVIVQ